MPRQLTRRQALRLSAASLAAAAALDCTVSGEEVSLAAREQSHGSLDVDRLHEATKKLLQTSGLPGLALAVIEDGQVAGLQGFGYANRRTKQPVTEETLFQAASLTKPTFAYVVLKLCEEGRLNLDVPLMPTYLPDLAPSSDPGADRITARMILSHSSGLPITHFPKFPEPLDFQPGERFGYSGAAYIYLQQVVEKVMEVPLEAVMDAYLMRPLGLTHGGYVWRPNYETAVAAAYDYDNSPIREADRSRPQQACSAASLHTTPADYARFLVELMFKKSGKLPLNYGMKRMMLSPQIRLWEGLAWGLGWGLRLSDDGDRFWHWGDSRGFMSYAVGSVALRRGVVVMANGRNGLRVAERIACMVMGPSEAETFDWIYNGFYVRNEAPIPPLPTEGGSQPSDTRAVKTRRTTKSARKG